MPLSVGDRLGPYEILAPLGAGGMGEVWKARDTRLDRVVAIKTSKVQFSERFEREARAIAALNHPNICTLYDVGSDYLVMEYIEGQPFRPPLPLDRAVKYAAQVADALGTAHAKGIIHRDIKPSNILITARGETKVLDFGLARRTDGLESPDSTALTEEMLTEPGVAVGTTPYMSPEQVRGQSVDRRTDLWALGVVLYQAVTGERPFEGATPGMILESVLTKAPVPARQRNPQIPAELERIIGKCLEKDCTRRYHQASGLLADLRGLERASDAPGVRLRRGRWRLTASLAGALVLAIAAYFCLHRAPKLTDKDTIVLADFDNKTPDPVFDDTLREGLAVQLKQSPFLSLISDQKIRQTLQLMGKQPDQKLTAEVTREVCERTGSAAMLTGSIASLGTRYVLGLRAVSCSTGETLDEQQVTSEKKEEVLNAVSDMASKFRARAGESLTAIRKNEVPLREATTSSLEALKAYTDALKGIGAGYDARTVPLLKQATEIDPQFASAWADLALAYSDLGEQKLARESTTNAYKWRDHTSGPEKFHIAYVYDRNVTGNLEKAWQTVSLWRQTYPRDSAAFELSAGYAANGTGRFEEVIKFAEMSRALDQGTFASVLSIVSGNLYLDRFDEASKAIQRYVRPGSNSYGILSYRYYLAFLRGDQAEMDKAVSESKQDSEVEEMLDHTQALVAAQAGRLKDADRLASRAAGLAEGAGQKETAATFISAQAIWNGFYGNAVEARQRAQRALSIATNRDVTYAAAFALALGNEFGRSQTLAAELGKAYPEDTAVQSGYLPTLRGLAAIGAKDPQKAIDLLQANSAYELGVPPLDFNTYFGGLYPVYVRGLAYLALNQGGKAAAEFQEILDHRGLTVGDPVRAMARLQLGRSYVRAGDNAKAKAAYQEFFNLWKDADRDIPLLKQATAEFAKL